MEKIVFALAKKWQFADAQVLHISNFGYYNFLIKFLYPRKKLRKVTESIKLDHFYNIYGF